MEALTRREDWRARLSAEIDRQRRTPFAWGSQDCAIGFGTAIFEALTGVDLARGYRGRYASPRGALKILAKDGSADLRGFVAARLPEIHPAFANVGDLGVVAADGPLGQAICMIDVSGLIVMTPDGHGRLPRDALIAAFKVG